MSTQKSSSPPMKCMKYKRKFYEAGDYLPWNSNQNKNTRKQCEQVTPPDNNTKKVSQNNTSGKLCDLKTVQEHPGRSPSRRGLQDDAGVSGETWVCPPKKRHLSGSEPVVTLKNKGENPNGGPGTASFLHTLEIPQTTHEICMALLNMAFWRPDSDPNRPNSVMANGETGVESPKVYDGDVTTEHNPKGICSRTFTNTPPDIELAPRTSQHDVPDPDITIYREDGHHAEDAGHVLDVSTVTAGSTIVPNTSPTVPYVLSTDSMFAPSTSLAIVTTATPDTSLSAQETVIQLSPTTVVHRRPSGSPQQGFRTSPVHLTSALGTPAIPSCDSYSASIAHGGTSVPHQGLPDTVPPGHPPLSAGDSCSSTHYTLSSTQYSQYHSHAHKPIVGVSTNGSTHCSTSNLAVCSSPANATISFTRSHIHPVIPSATITPCPTRTILLCSPTLTAPALPVPIDNSATQPAIIYNGKVQSSSQTGASPTQTSHFPTSITPPPETVISRTETTNFPTTNFQTETTNFPTEITNSPTIRSVPSPTDSTISSPVPSPQSIPSPGSHGSDKPLSLFPRPARGRHLCEIVNMMSKRHKENYYVDWPVEQVMELAMDERPNIIPVTCKVRKDYVSKSVMTENKKLAFSWYSSEDWGEIFREKLRRGDFKTLSEAKRDASQLWREHCAGYDGKRAVRMRDNDGNIVMKRTRAESGSEFEYRQSLRKAKVNTVVDQIWAKRAIIGQLLGNDHVSGILRDIEAAKPGYTPPTNKIQQLADIIAFTLRKELICSNIE